MQFRRILALGWLAVSLGLPEAGFAQPPKPGTATTVVTVEEPNAERTKQELSRLLEHYPPALRNVLADDPSLLNNQAYLVHFPALQSFLSAHPDVASSPSFYIEPRNDRRPDRESATERIVEKLVGGLSGLVAGAMALGFFVWLIRTVVDGRRWSRMTKIQTDVHTKLLDRFTNNDELLAYMQSPAGSKFLESAPISLDGGQRPIAAPVGRILWSVQAGVVVMAAGLGLAFISLHMGGDAGAPLHAFGVLGLAVGFGLVISGIIAYVISRRLGLIGTPDSASGPPARG